jgi:hypothetical protein
MRPAPFFLALAVMVAVATSHAAPAFVPGETLTFSGGCGLLQGVTADLTVSRSPAALKLPPGALRFTATGRSHGLIETLVPIRSTFTSDSAPGTLATLRYDENRSEGSRRYRRTTVMDYTTQRGTWTNHESGRVKKLKRLTRPAPDLLGIIYVLRQSTWKAGDVRQIEMFDEGRYLTLTVRAVRPRTEAVGLWAPLPVIDIVTDEIFEKGKRKRGRLEVTVTDDARHLPLRMRMGASYGTVNLLLTAAHGVTGRPLPPATPAR